MRGRKNTQDDFWNLVARGQGNACWPWLGQLSDNGYGRLRIGGRVRFTHQLAYEFTNSYEFVRCGRTISRDSILCLHRCDNPPCCNPGHLWLGTQLDNRRDCVAKGRSAKGDTHGALLHPETRPRGADNGMLKHPERAAYGQRNGHHTKPWRTPRGVDGGTAKLSENQVRSIRKLRRQGELLRTIAEDFGLSVGHVSRITTGDNWKHLI